MHPGQVSYPPLVSFGERKAPVHLQSQRTARQVAERAVILAALAFRGALEVVDHPHAAERARQILPWLTQVGCSDALDPIELRELQTPLGQLSSSEKIDMNWAHEGATFFSWMLGLAPPLPEMDRARAWLPKVLATLRPEAESLLLSATLRDRNEIEQTCIQYVLVLSSLRASRAKPPASDIVLRLGLKQLEEAGVTATNDAIARAAEAVARMTPEQRKQSAGVYLIRSQAARWYLSDRTNYFATEKS